MISPYKGKFKVTSIFGQRWGTMHQGLDLVGIDSKNIYATVEGKVEIAGPNDPNGFGTYVRILMSNGWRAYYGHLSQVNVKVNQYVKIGDLIGVEGSTGHSTGSHCHYEIRKTSSKDSYIDISKYSSIPNIIGVYDSKQNDSKELKPGTKLDIDNVKLYASAFAKGPIKMIGGTYYLYDGKNFNGKYLITNSLERVGVTPVGQNVSGFIDEADVNNSI